MQWMILPLKRYFDFKGRSRRMEFWMFALLNLIVSFVIGIIIALTSGTGAMLNDMQAGAGSPFGFLMGGAGILLLIWSLAILIPSIAVAVRRLHDRDMSGWWYLGFIVLSLIPFLNIISAIAFIVLMALPGTEGPNRFGSDPKDPSSATVFE